MTKLLSCAVQQGDEADDPLCLTPCRWGLRGLVKHLTSQGSVQDTSQHIARTLDRLMVILKKERTPWKGQ
jgi:hypothetical protein